MPTCVGMTLWAPSVLVRATESWIKDGMQRPARRGGRLPSVYPFIPALHSRPLVPRRCVTAEPGSRKLLTGWRGFCS
jgi:hypothetical protein